MSIIEANPRERAFDIMIAKNKLRLRDPITGHFLHLSGTGMTPGVNLAWLGTMRQADTLKQRAKAHGEDWTLQPVPREEAEPPKTDMFHTAQGKV